MSKSSPLRSFVLMAMALLLLAPTVEAGRIALSWRSVPGADGYRIYYGNETGEYTGSVDVGAETEGVLAGLDNCKRWHVAIKAINANGESAGYSNEIVGWPRPGIEAGASTVFRQGEQFVLELDGTNFHPHAELEFDVRDAQGNPLVRVESMAVVSCNRIEALVSVEPGARGFRAMEVGRHALWVRNPGNVVGGKFFEVQFDERRIDINRTSADTTDRVDAMDLVWLAHAHGAADGESRFNADADLNGDGFVDGEDLAHLASRFGDCWDGATWSPEACD